jgi:hypothetical protein
MTNPAISPEAPASSDPVQSAGAAHDPYAEEDAARVALCLARLERTAAVGMEMVEELPRRAAGLKPYGAEKYEAGIARDIAHAYKDVTTPVHQSIAFQTKLMVDRRKGLFGGFRPPAPRQDTAAPDETSPHERETASAPNLPRAPRPRNFLDEFVQRLLRSVETKFLTDDLYNKLARCSTDPVGVTLAKLAKAAGLEVDWGEFLGEIWVQREIDDRDPRSPFAFIWAHETAPPSDRPPGDPPYRNGPEPGRPPPPD